MSDEGDRSSLSSHWIHWITRFGSLDASMPLFSCGEISQGPRVLMLAETVTEKEGLEGSEEKPDVSRRILNRRRSGSSDLKQIGQEDRRASRKSAENPFMDIGHPVTVLCVVRLENCRLETSRDIRDIRDIRP